MHVTCCFENTFLYGTISYNIPNNMRGQAWIRCLWALKMNLDSQAHVSLSSCIYQNDHSNSASHSMALLAKRSNRVGRAHLMYPSIPGWYAESNTNILKCHQSCFEEATLVCIWSLLMDLNPTRFIKQLIKLGTCQFILHLFSSLFSAPNYKSSSWMHLYYLMYTMYH